MARRPAANITNLFSPSSGLDIHKARHLKASNSLPSAIGLHLATWDSLRFLILLMTYMG
jgi:hypothetical protein